MSLPSVDFFSIKYYTVELTESESYRNSTTQANKTAGKKQPKYTKRFHDNEYSTILGSKDVHFFLSICNDVQEVPSLGRKMTSIMCSCKKETLKLSSFQKVELVPF